MFDLTNNKRLVIISAEQAGRTAAANANASAALIHRLALDLATGEVDSIATCNGQYQGTPERSFMVMCDADYVATLQDIAERFKQECILVVRTLPATGRTVGSLHYPNGSRERIGQLQACIPGQEYEASTEIHGTDISFHFA